MVGHNRDPGSGPRLAALSGPEETAEILTAHCQHRLEVRYLSGLREHEEHRYNGGDIAMAGSLGGGS